MDTTNTTEIAPVILIRPWIRIFGASSYAVMAIISLTMNLILMVVLIKGHKQFKTMSFFIIAWQMLINDLLSLVFIQLTLAIPITYAGHAIYPPLFTQWVATIDTFCYNGLLLFCFVMTLNRFLVFMWPSLNDSLFTRSRVYGVIIIVWLCVLGHTTALNLCGCWKTYNTEAFYIEYTCKEATTFFEIFFTTLDLGASTYLPPFMLILYVIIFLEIKFNISYSIRNCRKIETTVIRNKKEISMLFQSVLICVVFELENLAFIFVPQIQVEGDLSPFINFFLTWSNLLLNTIHSIVLFSFNSMVRTKLKEIFSSQKSGIAVTKSFTDSNAVPFAARRSITIHSAANAASDRH